MKNLTTILFMLLNINLCYSQGAGLTKEETIKYINKKLKDVEGYKTAWSNTKKTAYILESKMIDLGEGKYKYVYYYSDGRNFCTQAVNGYSGSRFNKEFKVVHIKSITDDGVSPYNSSIGIIKIIFLENAVKSWAKDYHHSFQERTSGYGYTYNVWNVYFCKENDRVAEYETTINLFYPKTDPEDGKRLLKAMQYLVDLEKAADDPFGD